MGRFEPIRRSLYNEKALVLSIFLFTILIRLFILKDLRNDPSFLLRLTDSLEFDMFAVQLMQNNWIWPQLNNHTPLYAYFIASIYSLFGYGSIKIALIQYVISGFCAVLVYAITKRLIGQLAAIIAAIFTSTYWFFIYAQSYVFSENISMLLLLILVYLLLFWRDHPEKYLICGGVFGLAVICRPDIMLFGFFILFWLLTKETTSTVKFKYYMRFLICFALVLAPVVVRNYQISNEWRLRSQVGINVYMGNSPALKGSNIYVEVGDVWNQIAAMPYKELGARYLKDNEIDRFYISKTIEVIKQAPADWLTFLAEKTFAILVGREFLRSEDIYFFNRFIEGTLLEFVNTRLIMVLALAGIFVSLVSCRHTFLLLYMLLLSKLFIVFFSYKTRYLMPEMPFFMIFAGYTVSYFVKELKAREYKILLAICVMILVLWGLSGLNPLGITRPSTAETHYGLGVGYRYCGNKEKALEHLKRAVEINPGNYSVMAVLGLLQAEMGYFDEAFENLRGSLSLNEDPNVRGVYLHILRRYEKDPKTVNFRIDDFAISEPTQKTRYYEFIREVNEGKERKEN